jgi:hypothetical protein
MDPVSFLMLLYECSYHQFLRNSVIGATILPKAALKMAPMHEQNGKIPFYLPPAFLTCHLSDLPLFYALCF